MSFETRVFGKWILAGEHAVLRGSPALVFPLKSRFLDVQFKNGDHPLKVELLGEHGSDLDFLFWKVIDKACLLKQKNRADLTGTLTMKNTIPIGAGLGASAALCVGLAKWFQHLGLVSESEIYDFSRSLEDLFHGESSGVDIAVAISGSGIRFERSGARSQVTMNWKPKWYLSYSGKKGVTSECVTKVKYLIEQDAKLGASVDRDMREAVQLSEEALRMNETEGLPKLKQSMDLALFCFQRWGLTADLAVYSHLQTLKEAGAIAVKPTGSGGGGFVLSLWENSPPAGLQNELLACL